MGNEVTYEFYSGSFGGTLLLPDASFPRHIRRAQAYVDRATFGRADFSDQLIRTTVCEVADMLFLEEKKSVSGKMVASESTDGYSVSYVSEAQQGETAEDVLEKKAYKIIELYLSNTGLLCWEV